MKVMHPHYFVKYSVRLVFFRSPDQGGGGGSLGARATSDLPAQDGGGRQPRPLDARIRRRVAALQVLQLLTDC